MARRKIISQVVDDGFFKYNGTTDNLNSSQLPGYYIVNSGANNLPSDVQVGEMLALFVIIYPGQAMCFQLLFRYSSRMYIRRRIGSTTKPFTNWCKFDGIETT